MKNIYFNKESGTIRFMTTELKLAHWGEDMRWVIDADYQVDVGFVVMLVKTLHANKEGLEQVHGEILARVFQKVLDEYLVDKVEPLSFSLLDQCHEEPLTGSVRITPDGLGISIDGYSDQSSTNGTVIYLEKYDREVKVLVYSDVNADEPTHSIDLAGASVARRMGEMSKDELLAKVDKALREMKSHDFDAFLDDMPGFGCFISVGDGKYCKMAELESHECDFDGMLLHVFAELKVAPLDELCGIISKYLDITVTKIEDDLFDVK